MPSGSVPTNVVNGCAVRIYWSLVSQSVETNSSTVSWQTVGDGSGTVGVTTSHINGVQVGYSAGGAIAPGTPISSGTYTITHAADGTGTIGCAVVSSTAGSTLYGGTSWTLPTIPRYASITDAPNFNDLENPTITYSNPLGDKLTSLQACISLDGSNDDISYRNISKTGNSYKFNLTTNERNILRNSLGSSASTRNVSFVIRCLYSGATSYSSVTKSFTLASSNATIPTVTSTVTVDNTGLPSTFNGIAIQSKSKLNVTLSGSAKYNATIAGGRVYVDEDYWDGMQVTTGLLSTIGNVYVRPYVMDSRGFISSEPTPTSVYVHPYAKPVVEPVSGSSEVMCYRSDANGNPTNNSTSIWIKAKKSCSPITVNSTQKNFCTLRYRYKLESAQSWGNWETLLATSSSTDSYNALISGTFPIANVYLFQVGVVDNVGEYSEVTFTIPTEDITLHLGSGGKSVGVGRFADTSDPESLKVAWKTNLERALNVTGNASFAGTVSVTGDASLSSDLFIGGSKVSSFVFETGMDSSGYWRYRKWTDGMIELFGFEVFEGTNITYPYGNLYTSDKKAVYFPSGYIASGSYCDCEIHTFYGDKSVIGISMDGAATDEYAEFWFVGAVSASNKYLSVNVHVIGSWITQEQEE